jgi:hypothetical protein
MRKRTLLIPSFALMIVVATLLGQGSNTQHRRRPNFSSSLLKIAELSKGGALEGIGGGQIDNSTCPVSGDPAQNIDLSCDDNFSPENETPIAVDPNDPNHLLAGSNDYHLFFKGANLKARVPTGFFVSFDGGVHWIDGQIPEGTGASGGNGDPSPTFNAKFGTLTWHNSMLAVAAGFVAASVWPSPLHAMAARHGGIP